MQQPNLNPEHFCHDRHDRFDDADQQPVALIVSDHAEWRERAASTLARAGIRAELVQSQGIASQLLTSDRERCIDVALVDLELPGNTANELVSHASKLGISVVATRQQAALDDAVIAMRHGACDMLAGNVDELELVGSVLAAVDRTRNERNKEQRLQRLTKACQRLNDSRNEVVQHVDSLCSDLSRAYEEMTDQMNQVTTAAEFNNLVRQELDIESLLRTTLEFILSRSGPTNAAIFLPTTTGDFSLGAYVNYDCPKDTVDILLDHLANAVAPRFEQVDGIQHLRNDEEFERYIADDADWLCGQEVLAFACSHQDECLAIMMLFRDDRTPFLEPLPEQIETVGQLFADQLARVIHVHHRHLPKHKWGAPGDPEEGDFEDFEDFGGGGLAA